MSSTTSALALATILALAQTAFGQSYAQRDEPETQTGPGVKLGDNMSLRIPTSILVLIFVGFVAFMAWIVTKILNSEAEREAKKAEKAAQKAAQKEKRLSKKGGKKTE